MIVERIYYHPRLGVRARKGHHRHQSPQIELAATSCQICLEDGESREIFARGNFGHVQSRDKN